MASFKNISIKNKLVLIQVATAFIATMICSAFFLFNDIKTYKDSFIRNKHSIAEIIGVNLISPLLFNDQDAANEMLLHFNEDPSILNAAILDKGGKEFARYNKKGEETFSFTISNGTASIMQKFFEQKFIVSYQIFQEKEFIGTVMLRAEITDLDIIYYNYIKTAILILIISVLSAFIISNILQRGITNRLLSLVSKTKEVTETDNYSIRIADEGKDEIGILSEGFNTMLGKIEKGERTLKEINIDLEVKVKERTADLTKTQESLQLSEQKYRKIIDETGDAVYNSDYNGNFTYFNPSVKKITGYPENELIGKHFLELIVPEWQGIVAKFYKEQFDNRIKETIFSFPIITKSGEKKWIEQVVTQQTDGDKITGHNAIVRDITDRKKSEEKLKEYQYFFNNSHDFITITNESHFEVINPNFQKVLGYSEKELLEKRYMDLIHPDDLNATLQEIEKLKTGVETISFVNRYRKKDGSYLWFDWNSTPDLIKGKFYASARDITDRKKSDEIIKQKSEELVNTNKELEQFVYVASHDLQEPLRTITNFVGLIEKKYSGITDTDSGKYLQFIVDAAARMRNLIKDLLDLSRIGRNVTFTAVDCNEVFKEVIANMEASIKESNAKITSVTLPVLKGNASELKQLFQNLISNAIKFRKKNVIPEINITVEDKNTEYLFAIKDNGIGVEEQSINKLFVIFQRLNTATEYPGTGIGLATCKKIVALHNGKIWVESKFGEGSTFYFTLPKDQLT